MSLDERLQSAGPEGVFLRFVRRQTGRDDLFFVSGSVLAGSGAPAGIFVAMDTWVFGDPLDVRSAWSRIAGGVSQNAIYWAADGPPPVPDGWTCGEDQILLARPTSTPSPPTVSGSELFAARDRLHPDLAPLVPPPHLVDRLPFRLHGLEQDGQIVALADTTVDDGEVVALSQVHTAPSHRGRGLGSALVSAVLTELHALGRTTALWLCDVDNTASVALARGAGFVLHRRVRRFSR